MEYNGQYSDSFAMWKTIIQIELDNLLAKDSVTGTQIVALIQDIHEEFVTYMKDEFINLKHHYSALFYNILKSMEQNKIYDFETSKRKLSIQQVNNTYVKLTVGVVNDEEHTSIIVKYDSDNDGITALSINESLNFVVKQIQITMNDITSGSTADVKNCKRSLTNDAAYAYCWSYGNALYYTSSDHPSVHDVVYSDATRQTAVGFISKTTISGETKSDNLANTQPL